MRNKFVLIIIAITILLISILSGCLNNSNNSKTDPEERIIGVWERVNYDLDQTWEFTKDGKVIIDALEDLEMDYIFDNSSLYVIIPILQIVDKYQYNFESNDVLILNLVEGGDIIDPETGEIIDPQNNPTIITEFIFHRIS